MGRTQKSPKYRKLKEVEDLLKAEKPDYSKCKDPEFAKAFYELKKELVDSHREFLRKLKRSQK